MLINSWVMVSSKLGVFSRWNYGLEPKTLQERIFGWLSYPPSHIHHEPTLMCVCVFLYNKCIGVIGVFPPILSIMEALWFCYYPSLIQWKILLQTSTFVLLFQATQWSDFVDRIQLSGVGVSLWRFQGVIEAGRPSDRPSKTPRNCECKCRWRLFWWVFWGENCGFFRSCLVEFREEKKMEHEENMDIGHVSRYIW